MNKIYINLHGFNVSIFKKNNLLYVYVYNNIYYSLIRISQKAKIKLKTRLVLEINNKQSINTNHFKIFLKQFTVCESSKIKFTGKGYKIKKNSKKSLMLLFNRSHITTIWWKNIFIKKLKKYKLYIKYNPINKKIVDTILEIRFVNIFTKKGLRKARQILYKKKGKK